MNKELKGFEKSAPTSRPLRRDQSPVSAWDIDLSPFHSLIEVQVGNTRQLIDNFMDKMEELLNDSERFSTETVKKKSVPLRKELTTAKKTNQGIYGDTQKPDRYRRANVRNPTKFSRGDRALRTNF